MAKKKLTLASIICALGIMFYASFNLVYKSATDNILDQQVETSKTQADIISNILEQQLEMNLEKTIIIESLQKSIQDNSTEYSFICMFDTTGLEICHPDVNKIGKVLSENNSIIKSISNNTVIRNFKTAVKEKESIGGIRELENYTEIVYLSPVNGADWVVASHSNVLKLQKVFSRLKTKLILISLLLWLSSTLLIYYYLNLIQNESRLEILELNKNVSKKYFNEIEKINAKIASGKKNSQRLLASAGTKLTPVEVEKIAIVFTKNRITYIIDLNNVKTSINLTLDEVYNDLNPDTFYRASRQVIISIKAIDKIEKYGNTQLRVHTSPTSPINITISKYKLSDFKKWAGKN